MKKSLSLILAILLAASVLAGCGNQKQVSTDENQTVFTYWAKMPDALATQYSSMAEITMYSEMEKLTGVKIDFKHPPVGQDKEQFNLMIASGELPDMIEYDWTGYPGGPMKAIEDNVILKLNDLIEKNSPYLSKALQENSMYEKQSKSDDGTYFGYPTLNVGHYRTFGGLIVRKDWLDDLGLNVPETIEEWENVLRQFKSEKGAPAPFTGVKDILVWNEVFNGAYMVSHNFFVEDGDRVVFGPMEDGYKEFLTLMKNWYAEGLLDNEIFTNNGKSVDAKMTNGDSGVCYGYIGGTMGKYMTAMSETNPNYKLVAAQHPVVTVGQEPKFMDCQQEAQNPFVAITTACKNPDEAAKWLDFVYSPEGNMLKTFGLEGLTYNMENDYPKLTDLITKNPEGLSVGEAMLRHVRSGYPSPGFNQDERMSEQGYTIPEQVDALKIWSKYSPNATKAKLPPLSPTVDESDTVRNIMAEVNTFVDEMRMKFIYGTEPIENYDNFRQKLRDMNIETVIKINQTALERYNKR